MKIGFLLALIPTVLCYACKGDLCSSELDIVSGKKVYAVVDEEPTYDGGSTAIALYLFSGTE